MQTPNQSSANSLRPFDDVNLKGLIVMHDDNDYEEYDHLEAADCAAVAITADIKLLQGVKLDLSLLLTGMDRVASARVASDGSPLSQSDVVSFRLEAKRIFDNWFAEALPE